MAKALGCNDNFDFPYILFVTLKNLLT